MCDTVTGFIIYTLHHKVNELHLYLRYTIFKAMSVFVILVIDLDLTILLEGSQTNAKT